VLKEGTEEKQENLMTISKEKKSERKVLIKQLLLA
jgi:hypothetical protein